MPRREKEGTSRESLAGSLLLAHPSLVDGNFRRTVVLISAHDGEGAVGVVLNRPTGKRLGQFGPAFALGPLADVPVYSGGPVDGERLLLCAWRFEPEGSSLQLMFGIEPEKAAELAALPGFRIQAYQGYAGWSAGQLENELRHSTWVVTPLGSDLEDRPLDGSLWSGLLREVDPEWALLAGEPDDPSVN
jgi:putative transcriptional regulator